MCNYSINLRINCVLCLGRKCGMKKIILFGDSITAGYAEGEITRILTDGIQQSFPQFEVINAGIPGDTTEEALQRVTEHVLRYKARWVTLFFGINDLATQHLVTQKEFQQNMTQLVTQIGRQKILLLTPPWADPLLHQEDRPIERIQAYREIILKIGAEMDIPVLDVFQKMIQAEVPKQFLQVDGLHFSKKGYELLTQLISAGIKKKESDLHG